MEVSTLTGDEGTSFQRQATRFLFTNVNDTIVDINYRYLKTVNQSENNPIVTLDIHAFDPADCFNNEQISQQVENTLK